MFLPVFVCLSVCLFVCHYPHGDSNPGRHAFNPTALSTWPSQCSVMRFTGGVGEFGEIP